jgi:hypothetical protein
MRLALRGFTSLLLLILFTTSANAQEASPDDSGTRAFAGLKFGIGLSFTIDRGKVDRIDDASIDDNGIVRVNKSSNSIARIMLETHYFLKSNATTAIGPFVAVQPGSDEIINAIAGGVMLGLRPDLTSERSFNIGIGFIVDPSTKTLGNEFVEDQPAAVGPDGKPLAIRYQTRSQNGIVLLASFSWQ